jgi:hypothetical protein
LRFYLAITDFVYRCTQSVRARKAWHRKLLRLTAADLR